MVDGVLYRFTLRSCESTIKLTDPKAPKSSLYVDLSLYPPGTVIENELHWDEYRCVSKVPIWAHEKWLRKYQNAGDPDGTIAPEDTPPSKTLRDDPSYAPAFADGGKHPCEDCLSFVSAAAAASFSGLLPHIREAFASYYRFLVSKLGPKRFASPYAFLNQGGKRPCEDHPNTASATAATSGDPDGTITPKHTSPSETLRDDPSYAPALADGGKRPCVDRPSFVSATASVLPPHIREACAKYRSYLASKQGAEALKRPCEDFVEDHPSPTAAAHGGKRPCEDHPNAASATAATSGAKTEVGGLNSSASAYADPSAYGSEDYPGRYLLIVKDGGRIVRKVDTLRPSGPPKVKGGVYYPGQVPRVLKADKSSGNLY